MKKAKASKITNSANSGRMETIKLAAAFAWILLYGYFIMYLDRLDTIGCECAQNWRKTAIHAILWYLLIWIVLMRFLGAKELMKPVYKVVIGLNAILAVFFVVIMFQYIGMLKKEACKCSESMARNIMEVVNYCQILLMVLLVVLVVLHL